MTRADVGDVTRSGSPAPPADAPLFARIRPVDDAVVQVVVTLIAVDVGAALRYRVQLVDPRLGARLTWKYMQRREPMTTRIVEKLVRPGDYAIDIGANWGLFTWAFARQAGRSGRVQAIEPNVEHRRSLERITSRLEGGTVHIVALSDHTGDDELLIPMIGGRRDPYQARLGGRAPGTETPCQRVAVRVCTLDGLAEPRLRPSFVKCDVEGHELGVIRGAARTLGEFTPALLIEIEQRFHESSIQQVFAEIGALGYTGYAVHSDGLGPLDRFDVERDQLAHLGSSHVDSGAYINDFLFVPRDTDVTELFAGDHRSD